jgi:hypothetical protein
MTFALLNSATGASLREKLAAGKLLLRKCGDEERAR